ncbi:HNH endonuclease [Haloferula sp. A504]|uniref:HNH endonuclease n=1 Tax=Haloferula sp. A504 TaxID=3373601 RepID=UPI0031BE2BC0|nr:HNH endonuclease [Verrucomicrobiaceae bacterium E54]
MTTPFLHQLSVLVLNRHWLAIDAVTPADAFLHLASGSARALRIEDGSVEPLDWEAWLALDAGTRSVGTPRGPVRIPAVLVLNHFDRVPMHVPSFGLDGLWMRDGGRCQYTGRRLARHEADIDHVIPRSRGGVDGWENCVLSDKEVNRRKGARTPEEAGLRLLRQPAAPQPVPKVVRLRNLWKIPEWEFFLSTGSASSRSRGQPQGAELRLRSRTPFQSE